MPSARSLPALTCGIIATALENISGTWPLRTSVSAGASPLYGTCTSLTPASMANNSVARWVELPTPLEA